jgi:hypothetical protein
VAVKLALVKDNPRSTRTACLPFPSLQPAADDLSRCTPALRPDIAEKLYNLPQLALLAQEKKVCCFVEPTAGGPLLTPPALKKITIHRPKG